MSTTLPFIADDALQAEAPAQATELTAIPFARTPPWWRRHAATLTLLGLTMLGGALRFWSLGTPSLWGDEAATYARICGTYRELLEVLRDAWFPPLHYQMYWGLSRLIPMDPFGMRLIPAITGTLMVPAMYFLARQMTDVRRSLVASAFTATSAYLLAYSRDGKMYMEFWFCLTLATACLLWWTRTSRSTAYLGWVAAGVAMVGLHGMGFAMLALHVLFFLTGRGTTGPKAAALVLGLLVICSGDAVHYGAFNVVADQIEVRGWGAAGIDWADRRNAGQPTALIVADSAAAYFFSFLWIQEVPYGLTLGWVVRGMAWALGVVLALLLLGAMPWRRPRRDDQARLPRRSESPEPAWRVGWWLGLWIVLPAYAFYCASTGRPVSPLYWIESFGTLVDGRPWLAVFCLVSVCALTQVSSKVSRAIAIALPLALMWTLFDAVVRAGDAQGWWLQRWADRLSTPHVLGPLLLGVAAIWFDFSGNTTRRRLASTAKFMMVLAALLGASAALHVGIEGYFEKRAFVGGQAGASGVADRPSIWMPRWLAIVWPPLAIGAVILLMNLPTRGMRWAAIAALIAINLAQFTARLTAGTEAPHGLIAADLVTARDDATLRTYVERGSRGAGPGMASIESVAGSYYLARATGLQATPGDIRQNAAWHGLNVPGYEQPAQVARDVSAAGGLKRAVVWTQTRRQSEEDSHPDDDLVDAMEAAGWNVIADRSFTVRTFWNWAEFYQYRRREFVRATPLP